ncbi:MAG: ABC transporter ATP-binding protein [SAR324 cluster bacterium]|nr:ABC transporter ATP-binding protein [SAR324 cluster bacterium]MDP7501607.1 ABC transporter ATP-binding protein [SAR324 cluster bacterium]
MLEVKDLRTIFTTQDGEVNAVNGISFSLLPGEALGIVGESGCGKSVSVLSLMRLIPDPPGKVVGGEILFQGRDILKMNMNDLNALRGNQVAMVFQDPLTSLNPVLTIGRQIIETILLHTERTKEQAHRRTIELLKMVGIPEAEKRLTDYPHQFSGGMRQRVMIAMALSCDPQLLIADEPTTALDVTIQAQIVDLVKQIRKDLGMAVIWITHDLGVVASCVDKLIVMYAGQIVESAPLKEFFANPSHPYSIGLLDSLPRLDSEIHQKLNSIKGLPPILVDLPDACPFLARCENKVENCGIKNPQLRQINSNHEIACWVDIKNGKA